jgi:hypothetical protein
MKWLIILIEVFHVLAHSLVLLGIPSLLPTHTTTKIAYFVLDLSMGTIVLGLGHLSKTDRGSLWGILYGINIVNHCRAIAFLLGQSDDFMTDVYFLADNPTAVNVYLSGHIWYIVGTLVDIAFHSWNIHFLFCLQSVPIVIDENLRKGTKQHAVALVRRRVLR